MKNRIAALIALVTTFILFIQMPGMEGLVVFAETISMDTEITADTSEDYDVYGGTLTIAEGVKVTGNIYASGGAIVNSGEISRVTGVTAYSSLTNKDTGYITYVGYEEGSGPDGNITNDGTIENIYYPSGTITNGGTITNIENATGKIENSGTITSLSNLDAETTNTGNIGTFTIESGSLVNSGTITKITASPDLSDSVETLLYLNGGSVGTMDANGTVAVETSGTTTVGTMSGTYAFSGSGSLKVTDKLAITGTYAGTGTTIEVLDSTQIVIESGTSVDITYEGTVYTFDEEASGTFRNLMGTAISALILDTDTIDTSSGTAFSTADKYLAGETADATYVAAEGYYFPDDYEAATDGSGTITTTVKDNTAVNISYTFGADDSGTVTITLPAAAEEKEEEPEEDPEEDPEENPEEDSKKEPDTDSEEAVTGIIDAPVPGYYITGTKGENGYYVSVVTVNAPEGFLISDSENGIYRASLSLNGNGHPDKVYLKRISDGAKTKPVTLKEILVDITLPEITAKNDAVYYEKTARITISDENLAKVYVNGIPMIPDDVNCVVEIASDNSIKEYVIRAVDKAGNSIAVTFKVAAEWMKEGIVPGGEIVNLLTGNAYKLGDGSWKVNEDETTYNGNMTFYVNEEGNYKFEEQ